MGCTPEKLFKLEGDQLSTEALAGTRRRGDTPDADSALASEVSIYSENEHAGQKGIRRSLPSIRLIAGQLLHNEKDLREVMAVKDFLIKELREASTKVRGVGPRPLGPLFHLS